MDSISGRKSSKRVQGGEPLKIARFRAYEWRKTASSRCNRSGYPECPIARIVRNVSGVPSQRLSSPAFNSPASVVLC
jgi:hypothetical protein